MCYISITAAARGRSYTSWYGRKESQNQKSANHNMCFVSSQQQLGALWYGVAARGTFGGQSPNRAHYLRLVNARTALPPEYFVSRVYFADTPHQIYRYLSTGYCGATTDSPYYTNVKLKVTYIKYSHHVRNHSSTRGIRLYWRKRNETR